MNNTILIAALFITFTTTAQQKWGVSLGLSNQGQVDQELQEFYNLKNVFSPDPMTENKQFFMKYNLGAMYQLKVNSIIRFRFGMGQRKKEYDYKDQFHQITYNEDQKLFEMAFSYGVTQQLGRFKLSGGVELPLYLVGKYSLNETTVKLSDNTNAQSIKWDYTIDGGYILGLNSFLRGDYVFGKCFTFFTELNFGVLRSKFGNNISGHSVTYFVDGSPIQETYSETEKKQTKLFFSGIQAQFGISVHF